MEQLPPIDVVLLSHPHLDHMDTASLRAIVERNPKIRIVGACDTLRHLPDNLGKHAQALNRWEVWQQADFRITAVPAHHGNGRWIVDGIGNRDATAGFVIENREHTVYFADDTGYQKNTFREIGERFAINVALVPVGPAARPDWVHNLRKAVHASPRDALRIFEGIRAEYMYPCTMEPSLKSAITIWKISNPQYGTAEWLSEFV